MPGDLRSRARAALAARLAECVPVERLHAGREHALAITDALARSLDGPDVDWVVESLAARAKGELRPATAGTVQVHAAWSSTALAASAFAPWRQRTAALPLCDLGPFTDLRLEERLAIPHGGGTPNLDVALDGPGGLVGVEAKLTEPLAPRRPRPWKPAYRRPAMAAALDDAWRAVFSDLLADRWAPLHLDAGQLVRHALSLRRAGALVYLWWEPANGDDHPEVGAHRAEVAHLVERLSGAAPALHALSWDELLTSWEPVAPSHVAALRDRWAVRVPPQSPPPRRG